MWTKDVFTSVFSRASANGRIRLTSKYPKIAFMNNTPKTKIAVLPAVIISKLQGGEISKDIEGSYINGIVSNIQIEVITNTSQDDADYIADVCLDLMKSLRYEMVGETYSVSTQVSQYRNVARYRRKIDRGDII